MREAGPGSRAAGPLEWHGAGAQGAAILDCFHIAARIWGHFRVMVSPQIGQQQAHTMKRIWYFAQGDKPVGPITARDLAARFASGELPGQTLVWRKGMAQWGAAITLAEFTPLFSATPSQPPVEAYPGEDNSFAARRAAVLAHHPDTGHAGMSDIYQPAPHGHVAPKRNFGEAVAICLWKFVKFSGRASRSEYWYFLLFVILAKFFTSFLDITAQSAGIFTDVTTLVLLVPQMSVTWRRLHDTDHSGWWAGVMFLTPLFVIIGMMTLIATGMSLPAWATGHSAALAIDAAAVVAALYALTVFFFTLQPGVDRETRFG